MGNILHWLRERVEHWINPVTSVLIINILSDLTRSRIDLVVENVRKSFFFALIESKMEYAQKKS